MTTHRNLIHRTLAGAATGLLAGTILTSGLATPAAAAPSGTMFVNNGVLHVQLQDGSNDFDGAVTGPIGLITFDDNWGGLDAGTGCTKQYTGRIACAGYGRIEVWAGPGNDIIDLSALSTPATVHGGEGNDLIYGGLGDDDLQGDAGHDIIQGDTGRVGYPWVSHPTTGGNDVLVGGDGDDQLIGGRGADDLIGGAGNDITGYPSHLEVRGGRIASGVHVTVDNVANDGIPGEGDNVRSDIERVLGSTGDDTIATSSTRSLPGTPSLQPSQGYTFEGGAGNDTLIGGTGDDILSGDDGDDHLIGKGGADRLIGGNGFDRGDGSDGTDTCVTEIKTSCEA